VYAAKNGDQVIGTTRKDVCVLDGSTGKKIWSAQLSDIANVKKTDIQKYIEDAGVLFVYDKRMGKDVMICVDTKTGKELWENTEFENVNLSSIIYIQALKGFAIVTKKGMVMVDARTGKYRWTVDRFKGSVARYYLDEANNKIVLVNFKTGWGAIFSLFENQVMQVDAVSGNVDWVTSYEGAVETKLVTGDPLVGLTVTDSHVLLNLNGLEVFNRKNGQLIWKTHYDVSLNKGIAGSTQMYNAVADPLVVGNDVYIANFSSFSKKKVLQKFNLLTGQKVWESDKIRGDRVIIPNLYYVNNTVVIQIGGYVNIQGEQHSNNGTTYFSKWKWQGPFGLQAFDASSGSQKWESDKFSGEITNIITGDNKIFVADKKYVYAIDAGAGSTAMKSSVKKGGAPMSVFAYKDNIMVLGVKGLSAFKNADLSNLYTFKAKDVTMNSEFIGNNYYLHTEKMVVGVNLDNGAEKGHYKYIKGSKWGTTDDGNYFYVMGKKGVSKYQVNQ
jgi:hypothetical protein